mgnify:CR=1 FL=1
MLNFLTRRLIVAFLVAATVMTLAFILTRLSGDLATSIAGPNATQADIDAIRKAYGLDRPVLTQFFDWVGRALTGDLGESYFFKARVSSLIAERMPVTLTLGLTGLVIALVVSLPLGILAAVRENTALDRFVQLVALLGQAMPSFWLGLILMITLGLQLGWLPISGTGSWQHFVMPGIVLAFSAIPALTRLTRAGMIQAMGSDYIRTARAKGLSRASILLKHALRNAAIPVVAIAAVQLGPLGQAREAVAPAQLHIARRELHQPGSRQPGEWPGRHHAHQQRQPGAFLVGCHKHLQGGFAAKPQVSGRIQNSRRSRMENTRRS